MLTKSAKALHNTSGFPYIGNYGSQDSVINWSIPIKRVNGVLCYVPAPATISSIALSSNVIISSSTSGGIWIGNGTTPPTEDDYTLESRITSGLACSRIGSIVGNLDEHGDYVITMLIPLTNSSSSPITVSEIGVFATVNAANNPNTTSGSAVVICFDRTLLETPIEIPPNETATITYKVTYPLS